MAYGILFLPLLKMHLIKNSSFTAGITHYHMVMFSMESLWTVSSAYTPDIISGHLLIEVLLACMSGHDLA